MTPLAILILSLSMSTDAFAAAVGRGAAHRPTLAEALRAGAVFGIIESITPVLGWAAGTVAAGYVERVDHWIAFVLLALVGGHMIRESFADPEADSEAETPAPSRNGRMALVVTAIGTSIDAAAVGVGLAFVGVGIWVVAASIGVSTFLLTTIGMLIGRRVGARFGKRAELLGGIALIGIGIAILVEHLGLLAG